MVAGRGGGEPEPSDRDTALDGLIERIKSGDREALDDLIGRVQRRLRALAGTIIHGPGMPGPQAGEVALYDTEDFVQATLVDLWRKLLAGGVGDAREFFVLAAESIRCNYLDLARKHPNSGRSDENHLRDAAKFSRNRDIRTLAIYDDSLRDVGIGDTLGGNLRPSTQERARFGNA